MAHSPGSAERRAHLIREMARPGDRHLGGGSSDGSVQGEFPAYESESQQLPAFRPDHDFQINSSALRRAFPDFSQYGSSEEDSIEMGRGYKRSTKNTPNRGPPSEDVSENLPFTFGNAGKYRIVGTPPIKPRSANMKTVVTQANVSSKNASSKAVADNKENDSGAKETRYDSTSSRENEDAAVNIDGLRARVESDESASLGAVRPAPFNASTRNTRFDGRRTKQAAAIYDQTAANSTNTPLASAGYGTHQSFVLPDMPNITELISGVRQDGTPLFTRSAKSRSRFATPSQARRGKSTHIPVGSVAAASDDKALYVSLQLLQEKVMSLETEKASTEKKLEEYELEVLQLKSKLEEREHARNSDSGIGTEPDDAKHKHVETDKSNLELSIKTLQDRLERTGRKVTKSEATIQNLTKDRDAAHQQLAVAYLNSEELKKESQAMQDELEQIRAQVTRLNREHDRKIDKLAKQESELRGKIERREKAINEMSDLAKELWSTRNALAALPEPSNIATSYQTYAPDNLQPKKTRRGSQGTEQNVKRPFAKQEQSTSQARMTSKSTTTTAGTTQHHRVSSAPHIVYDSEDDHASAAESTTNINLHRPKTFELSKNSTYMSFMQGDEVSKLRRVVEEDKAKLAASRGRQNEGPTGRPLPRKSSLKRVQYKNEGDDATKTGQSVGFDKQHTRQSIASIGSERHRRSGMTEQVEMTSAFILPDITLGAAALHGHMWSRQGNDDAKQTVTIPRPMPVSERTIQPSEGEPDATIRPAQSPGLALAAVLKGLEDELAALREQLAQQEALYHKHDPALSKRKRKIVYARMQKLLAAIEIRADQIYALYDVLEGQKAKGQTMREDEVELTLQNIGIDPAVLRAAAPPNLKTRPLAAMDGAAEDESESQSEEDDDVSEELPWEGFEPTQTQTLDNIGRIGVR